VVRVAVRGRDVGRSSGSAIWVPPSEYAQVEKEIGSRAPSSVLAALKRRTCITTRNRHWLELHDVVPTWLLSGPKVLLPEIVSGSPRIEVDELGARLPLHSVIALRVPTAAAGHAIADFLTRTLDESRTPPLPRLSNGATRIQVSWLRDLEIPDELAALWRTEAYAVPGFSNPSCSLSGSATSHSNASTWPSIQRRLGTRIGPGGLGGLFRASMDPERFVEELPCWGAGASQFDLPVGFRDF
jgi:hypothetical protein